MAGHRHADDCPASLVGYRDTVDELTHRIECLIARRAVLTAHLRKAAHRNNCASLAHEREHSMTSYTGLPADLPVPEDDGAATHLPGMKVPHLELQGTSGTTIRLHALGAGRTVIYVYPRTGRPGTARLDGWDSIPGARGCTPEACGFRDHHQDLLAAGVNEVFGLSSQDTDYQREVVERLDLPFQMLSDPARTLAQALRLPTFETNGLTLYKRLTLIVRDDAIEHVFYPIFPPNEHAAQVLTWLLSNPL
jgi:peroxiredoxin